MIGHFRVLHASRILDTFVVREGVERRPHSGSPSTMPAWRSITSKVGGGGIGEFSGEYADIT